MSTTLETLVDGAYKVPLRTPTLPPATTTNAVVFGHRKLLVVEPATPHAEEQARFDAALQRMRSEGRQVVGIFLTHHHADHTGYAEGLRRRHDVPIYAHPATAERVDFEVDETVEDGWSLDLGDGYAVEAWHTPGHAPGHLVAFERKTKVAHAGDLVAGEGTILVDPHDSGDMGAYLESLRATRARVAGTPIRLVPAHGPTIDDPEALLTHYIDHRLARERKLLSSLERGTVDFDEVLAETYDDTPRVLWPLARRSLEAHLHKLVAERRVSWVGDRVRLR